MKVLKNMLAVIALVFVCLSAGYMYMQIKSIEQLINRMETINKENGIGVQTNQIVTAGCRYEVFKI